MRELRMRAKGIEGLRSASLDLVSRYVAEAHGPPPRSPLRFWVGGEWVERPSPEPAALVPVPEPLVPVPEPAALVPEPEPAALVPEPEPAVRVVFERADEASLLPAALEETPVTAFPEVEEASVSGVFEEPQLPIYEWVQSAAGENGHGEPEPGWPRTLVPGSGARRRIRRPPASAPTLREADS